MAHQAGAIILLTLQLGPSSLEGATVGPGLAVDGGAVTEISVGTGFGFPVGLNVGLPVSPPLIMSLPAKANAI